MALQKVSKSDFVMLHFYMIYCLIAVFIYIIYSLDVNFYYFSQREDLSRAHSAELEQMEAEWRSKLDVQHEKHLCAVQELNTRHTQKVTWQL